MIETRVTHYIPFHCPNCRQTVAVRPEMHKVECPHCKHVFVVFSGKFGAKVEKTTPRRRA